MQKFLTMENLCRSGNTLEDIKKEQIAKNKEVLKGYVDLIKGYRKDFSERNQKIQMIIKQFNIKIEEEM